MMIGISFTLEGESLPRSDNVEVYVRAFLSPTWTRPLRYLLMQVEGGTEFPRKPGSVRLKERAAVLSDLLVHPDVWHVGLSTSGKGPYGDLGIDNHERPWPRHLLCHGLQTLDAETPTRGDAWVTTMLLELAESIGVRHGIVTLMNDSGTRSEISFVGIRTDGINQHPFPDQFERMREPILDELGKRYVRFPRWGTIYSKAHVEQLGGAERIRDVVRPAIVRELGRDAFYFQLTDSIASATSAEAMQKQHAFTEIAEPLLPPRRA